jgi:flagellar export protein FliJ
VADPLERARQLRALAVATASRELAQAIAAEHEAATAHAQAIEAVRREVAYASRPDADDAAVEALAAWLPQGRAAVARAEIALSRAETLTAQARATLAAARTAEASVEALIDARTNAAAAAAERREQAALDEAAQRMRAQNA